MTPGGTARRPRAVLAGLVPLLLATAGGGAAQDFAPVAPAGATVTADRTDPAQIFDVAVGPATATAPPPVLDLAGPRRQIAFQAPPGPTAALALMEALSAQLDSAGFRTVFTCADLGCGGFDFRRARPILPMPAMYVDLRSFSYLAARKDGPGGRTAAPLALASILVSQSATAAFAQLTLITEAPAVPASATAPGMGSPGRPVPRPLPGARAAAAVPPDAAIVAPPPAVAPATAGPLADWTEAAIGDAFAASGRIVLDGTTFATGSTTIVGDPTPRVRALADWLKADGRRRVAVVGHSDWTGSVDGNLKVSRARAAAVAQQLQGLGVPAGQMRVDGIGPLAPLAPNSDAAGLQANRRVEVVRLPDAG